MKLLGLIIIFISSGACGMIKACEIKEREKQFSGFVELLCFIEREVSLYLTPQREIYDKFTNPALEKIGFIEHLQSGLYSENIIWSAICDCKDKITLPEEALEALKTFSEGFGKLSAAEETKNVKRILEALDEIYKKYKNDLEQKAVLYKTIGFVVGIGLVLLLW